MKLYRGQAYGSPVGAWWTNSRDVAEDYAYPNGEWVILAVDVEPEWAARHLHFEGPRGNTYQIPPERLREQALAVRVIAGHLRVPEAQTRYPVARKDVDFSDL